MMLNERTIMSGSDQKVEFWRDKKITMKFTDFQVFMIVDEIDSVCEHWKIKGGSKWCLMNVEII